MQKTLFFAAAKHQKRYFDLVCQKNDAFSVVWYKDIFPSFWAFSSHEKLAEYVAQDIEKAENTRGKTYGFAFKVILYWFKSLLARNLFARYQKILQESGATVSVVWNGLKFRQQIWCVAAESLGIKLRFMENGLVAGYTTLDQNGVNFKNSLPRTAAFYESYGTHLTEIQKPSPVPLLVDLPKRFVFVPLQVSGDSQIVCFSPWIKNMDHLGDELIRVASQCGTNGLQLVVKPHPKCSTPRDKLIQRLKTAGVSVLENVDSKLLVAHAEAVITINSTVGLEALEAGKKVIVLGQAFYNIPEITLSAQNSDELKSALNQIDTWRPNSRAVQGLFNYLKTEYQIPGDWRSASSDHVSALKNRLSLLEMEP